MKMIMTAALYNTIFDGLQKQFIDEENEDLNAAVDILQKFGQIFVDENPDNAGQVTELVLAIGEACNNADVMGTVVETEIIDSALYNLIVDSLQQQFVNPANGVLNAGIDVVQKLVGIMLDGDAANKEQYLKLLRAVGAAVREANLLD